MKIKLLAITFGLMLMLIAPSVMAGEGHKDHGAMGHKDMGMDHDKGMHDMHTRMQALHDHSKMMEGVTDQERLVEEMKKHMRMMDEMMEMMMQHNIESTP